MNQTIEVASTGYLLGVAAVAIALLLVLIMKFKVHAFASLILVSFLTALATGIELPKIVPDMLSGFGGTLASVAVLVGLGAMIGKILEYSGGAQTLADSLIAVLGEKRAPLALGIASLLFGFPIFFDAGLVVMLPVILSVAARLGGSVLLYALPATCSFSVMHAFLPPHPGPVAAAGILGANVGMLLIVGLIVALPTWYIVGYLYGTWCGRKWIVPLPKLFAEQDNKRKDITPPKFTTVVCVLLLPMVLIFLNTGVTTLQASGVLPQNAFFSLLTVLGQTPIALLITLLLAVLIFCKPFGGKKLNELCENALAPVCSVILVTGAGGMFGGILRASGIGDALAATLNDLGIPVILAAFIISGCLRIAQGSATVALTTAAALIAPIVHNTAGLSSMDICAIVAAISGGSIIVSHFNDSGFWLVKGLFGIDEKLTLKTWTVLETMLGTVGFAISCILYVVF
ncbi:MAG: GntP family permease [Proteobacteria bacterium]|uniref:GntP family permease n=1 Tax=Candidatus Avisuccinivibrio stercorigallinarum TaxID=2840704 RepID=A0A9D9DAT4_9GAMM|nr:GntP family permease [Candidatus Avisuccinivibrio stercorigallinarum]